MPVSASVGWKTSQNTGKSTVKETLIFLTAYRPRQVGFKAIKAPALEAKSSVATDTEAVAWISLCLSKFSKSKSLIMSTLRLYIPFISREKHWTVWSCSISSLGWDVLLKKHLHTDLVI